MPFIVHYITPCLENHGHYSCSRAFFSDFPCVASRSRKCNLTEKCSKLCFFIQYRDFFPCAESTEAECPLTEKQRGNVSQGSAGRQALGHPAHCRESRWRAGCVRPDAHNAVLAVSSLSGAAAGIRQPRARRAGVWASAVCTSRLDKRHRPNASEAQVRFSEAPR